MDYLFYIGLGVGIIVLFLYLRAKKRRTQKMFTTVDAICLQFISNHPSIHYTPDDTIFYYGSIPNTTESLAEFKLIQPFANMDLLNYFRNKKYDGVGDNLLIYKVNKVNPVSSFIVIIDDPVDMNLDYSLFEIIGPLE